MLFERSPSLVQWMTPSLVWRIDAKEKEVYLTFDDGPVPEVTPWVLDLLDQHQIKATFFCVGENVKKYPDVFSRIIKDGHVVGNHTFNHMQLFKTDAGLYRQNIKEAAAFIDSKLFRPPHGQINVSMMNWLKLHKYRIVMWDVLTADYDKSRTGEQCFDTVKRKTRPGSIVLFHDSVKAQKNLQKGLPLTIGFLKAEGWKFKTLT